MSYARLSAPESRKEWPSASRAYAAGASNSTIRRLRTLPPPTERTVADTARLDTHLHRGRIDDGRDRAILRHLLRSPPTQRAAAVEPSARATTTPVSRWSPVSDRDGRAVRGFAAPTTATVDRRYARWLHGGMVAMPLGGGGGGGTGSSLENPLVTSALQTVTVADAAQRWQHAAPRRARPAPPPLTPTPRMTVRACEGQHKTTFSPAWRSRHEAPRQPPERRVGFFL